MVGEHESGAGGTQGKTVSFDEVCESRRGEEWCRKKKRRRRRRRRECKEVLLVAPEERERDADIRDDEVKNHLEKNLE